MGFATCSCHSGCSCCLTAARGPHRFSGSPSGNIGTPRSPLVALTPCYTVASKHVSCLAGFQHVSTPIPNPNLHSIPSLHVVHSSSPSHVPHTTQPLKFFGPCDIALELNIAVLCTAVLAAVQAPSRRACLQRQSPVPAAVPGQPMDQYAEKMSLTACMRCSGEHACAACGEGARAWGPAAALMLPFTDLLHMHMARADAVTASTCRSLGADL